LKLVNQYIIPFKGLTDGEHEFQFELGKPFFDEHELLEARDGNIEFMITVVKKPTMLLIDVSMSGTLNIQCDRCLEYFDFPVDYESNFIVKFSDEPEESTDEIWILHSNDHEIDFNQYFFDSVALSLPLQKTHPDDADGSLGCDREMLKLINKHSLPDYGKEDGLDKRWNKLKDLLNDTNKN
jgi:uncharacterized protein